MGGVAPLRMAIGGLPSLPAAIGSDWIRDLAGATDGSLRFVVWIGGLLAICLIARWRYGGSDRSRAMDVEYAPPDLPPEEAYETALAFGESKRPLAERLYDSGDYESACNVYEAVAQAYESALETAERHGFDRDAPYTELVDARKALRTSRRRRQFWGFSFAARASGGGQGPSYNELLDRAESTQSWAEKLYQDGHYESARTEFEAAQSLYEDAVVRARENLMDPSTAESGLRTVESRIDVCRANAS